MWKVNRQLKNRCIQILKFGFFCLSSSNVCVPNDFVCDNERDCPGGEDEQYCYGLEYPKEECVNHSTYFHDDEFWENFRFYCSHDGYGQVIEQTFGIWHTKCFPTTHEPTTADVAQLCVELGYHQNKPSYRLIDPNNSSTYDRLRND